MTMIKAILLCFLLSAGGCAQRPNSYPVDILSGSFQPSYVQVDNGMIMPSKCLSTTIEEIGERPVGCYLDRAFSTHVASSRDLIYPRNPGPLPIRSIYSVQTTVSTEERRIATKKAGEP